MDTQKLSLRTREKDNVKHTALRSRKEKGVLKMPDAESMIKRVIKAQKILNSEVHNAVDQAGGRSWCKIRDDPSRPFDKE